VDISDDPPGGLKQDGRDRTTAEEHRMTQSVEPAPQPSEDAESGAPTVRELLAELVALEDELRECPEAQRPEALAREQAILEALHRRPASP
jgi:hypothetical protein